jgi:UDP-N-acetylglucosamine 2-epimerase (non-hydrolysing)
VILLNDLKLAGTDEVTIYALAKKLLTYRDSHKNMSKASNPYGDGKASQRIVEAILYNFGKRTDKPSEF